jgi:hypothetical protein
VSRRELVERVVAHSYRKACRNPFFVQQLVKDPNSALGEILKEVAPESGAGMAPDEAKEVIAEVEQVLSLAPFLKREEISKIVKYVVEHTARAYTSTVDQCRVLFWLGIVLTLAVVGLEAYAILGHLKLESAVAGGLLGGGLGFGFIYTALVRRPLEQMQNSAGNLAQIQMIFLGFLDQISILMAKAEDGSLKDTLKVIDRMGRAVEEAASRIERFCEYPLSDPRMKGR